MRGNVPRVSVVIPTYNRAQLIAESIKSVLDQTFTDFELIVVDDGSTDNTREVVDSFQDSRIRYICLENRGAAAARNNGIQASSGEYVAFLDSDDVLLKKALESGVQVLDRHPEVAFSCGQIYRMDEKGRVFGVRKLRCRHASIRQGTEEIVQFLVYGNHINTMTVMARRSCLFEVGLFDTTFRYGSEDFDLFVRLAKKYAVAYIAKPIAKAREHSGRISNERGTNEEEKSKIRVLEGIINDTELGSLLSHLKSKAYFYLHLRLARHAYRKGEMKTAREQLFRALKIHPKGFFKSLWLPWIYMFVKTWVPFPILRLVRAARCYLFMVLWYTFYQFQTIGKRIGYIQGMSNYTRKLNYL
jgi:glycosyltransferase involved in cell wall biosynthesis